MHFIEHNYEHTQIHIGTNAQIQVKVKKSVK